MEYNHARNQNYTPYNDSTQIAKLDLNKWEPNQECAGRHMYKESTIYGVDSLCNPHRDTDIHYIMNVERADHPQHASRFGYANFPNGYGLGVQPQGFFSNDKPPACQFDTQPPNMAPSRFYTKPYQGRNNNTTQAVVDWNNFAGTFTKDFGY